MTRRFAIAVPMLLAVLLTVTPAWAACALTDLTGSWFAYAVATTSAGAFWERCTLRVEADGDLVAGTPCRFHDDSANSITGGHLNVSSSCVVTGTILTAQGSAIIKHAALDRGKTVISGVGAGSDLIFLFSAIKR